jgi:hypothetical protein
MCGRQGLCAWARMRVCLMGRMLNNYDIIENNNTKESWINAQWRFRVLRLDQKMIHRRTRWPIT